MAWVKTNDGTIYNTNNPTSVAAFANALTNPSLIIVGMCRAFSGTIDLPTDTAGNTYLDCGAGTVLYNASGWSCRLAYALNTTTQASNVVSVANGGSNGTRVSAVEFTGGAIASIVDVFASNPNASTGTGGGQNMTSTAAITTVDGDLIIGMEGDTSISPPRGAVGTGFTTTAVSALEYLVQTSAASIAATWADATDDDPYAAIMCAFKQAASAASPVLGRRYYVMP